MIETKNKSVPNTESLSKAKKEEIFNEYIKDFVIDKSIRVEREKSVLADKIKILTKGKDIVIDNIIKLK